MQPHTLAIHAQYIKDLSFENPKAPSSFQLNEQPEFQISVDVQSGHIKDQFHEVGLAIGVRAVANEEILFQCELIYCGIFGVQVENEDELEKVLLVQCPQILFPFARRVIADCTQDGGYPAVSLSPIDFYGVYIQKKDAEKSPPANANN